MMMDFIHGEIPGTGLGAADLAILGLLAGLFAFIGTYVGLKAKLCLLVIGGLMFSNSAVTFQGRNHYLSEWTLVETLCKEQVEIAARSPEFHGLCINISHKIQRSRWSWIEDNIVHISDRLYHKFFRDWATNYFLQFFFTVITYLLIHYAYKYVNMRAKSAEMQRMIEVAVEKGHPRLAAIPARATLIEEI